MDQKYSYSRGEEGGPSFSGDNLEGLGKSLLFVDVEEESLLESFEEMDSYQE